MTSRNIVKKLSAAFIAACIFFTFSQNAVAEFLVHDMSVINMCINSSVSKMNIVKQLHTAVNAPVDIANKILAKEFENIESGMSEALPLKNSGGKQEDKKASEENIFYFNSSYTPQQSQSSGKNIEKSFTFTYTDSYLRDITFIQTKNMAHASFFLMLLLLMLMSVRKNHTISFNRTVTATYIQ